MVPPGASPALSRRGQIHTYPLARRSRRWGAVAPFPLGLLGLGLPRLRLTAAAVAAGAALALFEIAGGLTPAPPANGGGVGLGRCHASDPPEPEGPGRRRLGTRGP
jgi:hypothetical protein